MAGVKGRSGGRNARTSQEHVFRGSFRTDRHGDRLTPEPPRGNPEPPKPLEGDALAEWDRMVARMTESRTLCTVDDAVLYQYAWAFAEVEELRVDLVTARGSATILEENIAGLKGPDLVAVFQEIAKLRHDIKSYSTSIRQGRMAVRQYLVELGQTPASRARVHQVSKKAEKPKSKWAGILV